MKKVIATIERTVIEKATVTIDNEGDVDEIHEIHEELECDVTDIRNIQTVLSEW